MTDWHKYFHYPEIDLASHEKQSAACDRQGPHKKIATEAKVVSRMVEYADLKDRQLSYQRLKMKCATMRLTLHALNDCEFATSRRVP